MVIPPMARSKSGGSAGQKGDAQEQVAESPRNEQAAQEHLDGLITEENEQEESA